MNFKRSWNKQKQSFVGRRGGGTVAKLAYVLALIGGIVIIVLSLAAILHFPLSLPFTSPLAGYFGIGIITLILGIVAVVGSRRVNELIWAIALMVIGFLGGGVGGLLALIGGLLGLLSRYV